MRALLINPWIYDFAAYDLWSKPLGLLTIAGYLKRLGCEVSLIDCQDRLHPSLQEFLATRQPPIVCPAGSEYGDGRYYSEVIEKPSVFEGIPRRFKRYGLPRGLFEEFLDNEPRPDIILVTSGMTYWYPACFDVIKIVRRAFPGVPVALGGIYVNLCFQHAREHSGADVVYRGNAILEILRLIEKITGTDFDYTQLDDDTDLFPAYELYPELSYITLRTSHGCPFRCSYCGWYLLEKEFGRQDPDFVVRQINHFYRTYHVRDFAFYDEALLYEAERHIIPILQGLIKRKIDARFHTPNGLHSRFVSAPLAALLKESGFVKPRLSLETIVAKRQASTGAKTTTADFLKAVKHLRTAGFKSEDIGAYIMIGLPDEPVEEIRDSIAFVASQNIRVHLEEYSPIPQTPYYELTGLPPDADPLLHNNSVFAIYRPERNQRLRELKTLTHAIYGNPPKI